MEAATSQSGSTRVRPLVLAVVASIAIASLIGLGAVTGKRPSVRGDEPLPRVEAKLSEPSVCASCGTVEAIRMVEVLEDAGGATAPKTGKDVGEASPGFAMSMLDTLSGAISGGSGSDAAKNARKRYAYRVTVRMDDGSFRTISVASPPAFAAGEKVRVVEGRLVRS